MVCKTNRLSTYLLHLISIIITGVRLVSISSGQRNLMKTYHNEANTGGITKIASKKNLDSFGQIR